MRENEENESVRLIMKTLDEPHSPYLQWLHLWGFIRYLINISNIMGNLSEDWQK